ncbi:Phytochrome-like protein cph2 [compost metagenome]
MLTGSYDYSLVFISLLVAILASYTALDLAGRVASSQGRGALLWIGGGALAMGIGIWSMHFIGMLAFSLPIPLGYDLPLTLLSLVIAVLVSGFALWLVSQPEQPLWQLAGGALAMGAGKNGYSFFEQSMNTNARNHLQLLHDLRQALDAQEFVLHYQPKFAAGAARRAIGAEALLRWQHPRRGLLMPDEFIALAEKTGLIIPIGNWVLDEACRQMSRWYAEGRHDWRVAVNLSALQFCHVGLIDSVRAALERHALPANCLTLEITETTAMQDADTSLSILRQLAEMGVDLSIDDFGTGYSSLLYLKRLPANELKIDRGFVRDLERDSDDAAIISAIVALGQALDLRIVAEGVETESQQAFLTGLGCDSLQGFLFGKPLPAEQFMSRAAALA